MAMDIGRNFAFGQDGGPFAFGEAFAIKNTFVEVAGDLFEDDGFAASLKAIACKRQASEPAYHQFRQAPLSAPPLAAVQEDRPPPPTQPLPLMPVGRKGGGDSPPLRMEASAYEEQPETSHPAPRPLLGAEGQGDAAYGGYAAPPQQPWAQGGEAWRPLPGQVDAAQGFEAEGPPGEYGGYVPARHQPPQEHMGQQPNLWPQQQPYLPLQQHQNMFSQQQQHLQQQHLQQQQQHLQQQPMQPPMQQPLPQSNCGRGGFQHSPSDRASMLLPADWGDTVTVMMRNLPNRYTRQMLLEEIGYAGFSGEFDFFYLPIDPETGANKGYAFLNFVEPQTALRFRATFEGSQMAHFNSNKRVSVTPAALQGLEANYAHYSTARCSRGDPEARPIFVREPRLAGLNVPRPGGATRRGTRKRGGVGGGGAPWMEPQADWQVPQMGAQHGQMQREQQPQMPQHVQQMQPQPQQMMDQGAVQSEAAHSEQLDSDVPKFCPYCGGPVQPDFRFCQFCGATLRPAS